MDHLNFLPVVLTSVMCCAKDAQDANKLLLYLIYSTHTLGTSVLLFIIINLFILFHFIIFVIPVVPQTTGEGQESQVACEPTLCNLRLITMNFCETCFRRPLKTNTSLTCSTTQRLIDNHVKA